MVVIGFHFGGHWISDGRSARCFSMYLALPKLIEIMSCSTAVPLKLENVKNENIYTNEGPIHSAFLHAFTFLDTKHELQLIYLLSFGATWSIWGPVLAPTGFVTGPQIDKFSKKLNKI